MAERLLDLAAGLSSVLNRVQALARRLLELHVLKLVALYTVWVALKEVSVDTPPAARVSPPALPPPATAQPPPRRPQVSVMNFLLVALWAFALPYPRFRPMASCLATVWTCVIIVCKMLYQLKVVSPHEYSSNCTEVRPPEPPALSAAARATLLAGVQGQVQRARPGAHGAPFTAFFLPVPRTPRAPGPAGGLPVPRHP